MKYLKLVCLLLALLGILTGCAVYRTDELGTVIAFSDGKDISFRWEQTAATPDSGTPADVIYIGNVKSKKFHVPGCSSLPSEQNRTSFSTYEQAVDAGYTPCGNCMG